MWLKLASLASIFGIFIVCAMIAPAFLEYHFTGKEELPRDKAIQLFIERWGDQLQPRYAGITRIQLGQEVFEVSLLPSFSDLQEKLKNGSAWQLHGRDNIFDHEIVRLLVHNRIDTFATDKVMIERSVKRGSWVACQGESSETVNFYTLQSILQKRKNTINMVLILISPSVNTVEEYEYSIRMLRCSEDVQ